MKKVSAQSHLFIKQYFRTTSEHAKQKLLQMPLVIIRSGSLSSGRSELFVMEHIAGVDYVRIAQFLDCTKQQASISILLTKSVFTQLLGVAHTERERQSISYCVFKSLGLSFKSARHHLGFSRMAQRIARIEKSISEIQTICECADRVSLTKEKTLLRSLGDLSTGNSNTTDSDGHSTGDGHSADGDGHSSDGDSYSTGDSHSTDGDGHNTDDGHSTTDSHQPRIQHRLVGGWPPPPPPIHMKCRPSGTNCRPHTLSRTHTHPAAGLSLTS